MSWLADLFSLFRPNTEAFRAITAEITEMKNEWKERYHEQEKINAQLQMQVHELERHEEACHRKLIDTNQKYMEVKQELLFLTKEIARANKNNE